MINFEPFFDPAALKPGFRFGEPAEVYFAQPSVNASTLKQPTPLEMLYAMRKEFQRLKYSFQLGSLVHKAILEPNDFDSDRRDDWLIVLKTKSLKTKEAEAAYEANPEKIIATPEMVEKAARAKEAVWKHDQLRWCLEQPGDSEVSATAWHDPTNCWRKARIDWRPKDAGAGWLLDLKTTSSPLAHWSLGSDARRYGYDVQAYHYAGVSQDLGSRITHFALGWIAGPWGEYLSATEAPTMARMTTINRDPEATPSLLSVQPIYDDRLGKFCNAAATGDWEAWEHEQIELGTPF